MIMRYRWQVTLAQLNLLDSHDVSRFFSLCCCDERKMGLAVVFIFTFPGMPCVFYGDELGLEGEEERDYRQPMDWKKKGGYLFDLYKELIGVRKREKTLRDGLFVTERITEEGVYIYSRRGEKTIRVIINRTNNNYYVKEDRILAQRGYDCGVLAPYGFIIAREKE